VPVIRTGKPGLSDPGYESLLICILKQYHCLLGQNFIKPEGSNLQSVFGGNQWVCYCYGSRLQTEKTSVSVSDDKRSDLKVALEKV